MLSHGFALPYENALFAEKQVHDPASSRVLPSLLTMGQHFLIVAPRLLQCQSEFWHPFETMFFVDSLGKPGDLLGSPGRFNGHGPKRKWTEDVAEQRCTSVAKKTFRIRHIVSRDHTRILLLAVAPGMLPRERCPLRKRGS